MTPPTLIAIVNQSTVAGLDEKLPAIVHALGRQLAEDVQPVWGRVLPALELTQSPPAHASRIVIFDDADQAGALGYHDEGPDGVPYAKVFAKTILGYGGTLTDGANSVSVTISHELLEMVGDPSANWWADAPDGFDYALELCDPCEGDAYEIDGVYVSDFVFPAFFDGQAEAGARFDKMGTLGGPFSMSAGGYLIRRAEGGKIDQVFASAYPTWKLETKKHAAARSAKRSK